MKRILLAFQFLTIIPLKDVGEVSDEEAGGAAAFFPLVGFVEGVIYVVLAAFCLKVLPSEVTNGLLLFVMILVNGGLHLDGLSDTFDALAVRGDRERKLSVMKEGTIGPAGVVAIVLVVLLKYLLLNAVYFHSSLTGYFLTLMIMPVLSRWSMLPAIYHCNSARQDGLGRVFIEHTGAKEFAVAMALTAVLFTAGIFAFCTHGNCRLTADHLQLAGMIPVLYLYSLSTVWFFHKHFGGMTGDSFGTVNEIAVFLFLLLRVIWLQNYT